jgi:2-polyprenyl-3-methyl-5-hydroxy-6-metoxy-1,4-benzoquinol methylase
MSNPETSAHLTDSQYWSDVWERLTPPTAIDPATSTPQIREYCNFFESVLAGRTGRILEIGCGASPWLPYFAKLGFQVAGVDYSKVGCEQSRDILARAGIHGDIYDCDAFDPLPELLGAFDAVVSLGVVEHFKDTVEPIRAFAKFLRPGGMVLSTCPNMAGILGFAQKVLNRPVYERHVPLTLPDLRAAHLAAGLTEVGGRYLGNLDFHVANVERDGIAVKLTHKVLMRLTRIGDSLPVSIPRSRIWSCGVGFAAVK